MLATPGDRRVFKKGFPTLFSDMLLQVIAGFSFLESFHICNKRELPDAWHYCMYSIPDEGPEHLSDSIFFQKV